MAKSRRRGACSGMNLVVRALALCAAIAAAPAVVAAPLGSVTGLPLPRYASLKTDRVNLREGPSKDHGTKWVFQRAGLPVEITAEFATWRKPISGASIPARRSTEGSRPRRRPRPLQQRLAEAPDRAGGLARRRQRLAKSALDPVAIGVVERQRRQQFYRATAVAGDLHQ